MKTRSLTILALLAMAPNAVVAEVISGSVRTEEGAVVPGFPVIVSGSDGSFVAMTDANGEYRFNNLPAGEYSAAPANEIGDAVPFEIESQDASPCMIFCGAATVAPGPPTSVGAITVPQNWSVTGR